MESKYQNGKIYKIVDAGYKSCYIGSTVQLLSNRMAKHRNHYRAYKKGLKSKITIFDLFDEYEMDNCKIELIENYPCNTKEELLAREGYYQEHTNCINKYQAGRTQQQYRKDNEEKIREYKKTYNEKHKEKIKEIARNYREENDSKIRQYRKEYYISNKDKIDAKNKEYEEKNKEKLNKYRKEYREINKEKRKQYADTYRETHKDVLNKQCNEWYEKNKERILEQRKIKIECCCGSSVRKCDMWKHVKSKKHQDYIKSLQD